VPGIQFMDYVDPGQVIRLGAHDRIVLGYLKSCWRETISGGTVTVGPEQSEVAGGEAARAKVACEGGKMMRSAELAGKSGAMVFRQARKSKMAFIAFAPRPSSPPGGIQYGVLMTSPEPATYQCSLTNGLPASRSASQSASSIGGNGPILAAGTLPTEWRDS
jgi:hypothetical protein